MYVLSTARALDTGCHTLDGVLALRVIGTLDSARTQVMMKALFPAHVDTGAEIAIIGITGVSTVDAAPAEDG